VRLEHPNAPVERRTVELTPGETRLLDVTLHVSTERDAAARRHGGTAAPSAERWSAPSPFLFEPT